MITLITAMKRSVRLMLCAWAMIAATAAAQAQTADPAAFERIITSQITAFRADQGTEAFAHASPVIRRHFGTAENFMAMVRNSYPQVYRPRSFRFGKITTEMSGRPTQRVHITDAKGQSWTALYAFEQQPDGTWRIAGVVMLREADVSA